MRIDYEIGSDFDMSFTDYDDLRVVKDNDALLQSFLLAVSEHASALIGSTYSTSDVSRVRKRVRNELFNIDGVTNVLIEELTFNDGKMTYKIAINNEEFSGEESI